MGKAVRAEHELAVRDRGRYGQDRLTVVRGPEDIDGPIRTCYLEELSPVVAVSHLTASVSLRRPIGVVRISTEPGFSLTRVVPSFALLSVSRWIVGRGSDPRWWTSVRELGLAGRRRFGGRLTGRSTKRKGRHGSPDEGDHRGADERCAEPCSRSRAEATGGGDCCD